jgi:hypothetical protein
MIGVREYCEGMAVELWRDGQSGRLVIKAWNEAGHNSTEVDLCDLIHWLSLGSGEGMLGVDVTDRLPGFGPLG